MSDGQRHPATTALLRHFETTHLPQDLADVSAVVGGTAFTLAAMLPDGPELTTGLRKLLEAKDCFVRAAVEAVVTGVATLAGLVVGAGIVLVSQWAGTRRRRDLRRW